MRLSPMPHPRSALRLLATLLVAGHALASLLTALHGLHVDHVRCAEHGEMVHVHDEEGADDAPAASQAAPDDGAQHIGSSAPPLAHAHDHCQALSVREQGDAFAMSPASAVTLPGAPSNAVLVARSAPQGTIATTGPPPLTLAPKTSPPSA